MVRLPLGQYMLGKVVIYQWKSAVYVTVHLKALGFFKMLD